MQGQEEGGGKGVHAQLGRPAPEGKAQGRQGAAEQHGKGSGHAQQGPQKPQRQVGPLVPAESPKQGGQQPTAHGGEHQDDSQHGKGLRDKGGPTGAFLEA